MNSYNDPFFGHDDGTGLPIEEHLGSAPARVVSDLAGIMPGCRGAHQTTWLVQLLLFASIIAIDKNTVKMGRVEYNTMQYNDTRTVVTVRRQVPDVEKSDCDGAVSCNLRARSA